MAVLATEGRVSPEGFRIHLVVCFVPFAKMINCFVKAILLE